MAAPPGDAADAGAGSPPKRTAGGKTGARRRSDPLTAALLAASVASALLALFWPQITPHAAAGLRALARATGAGRGGGGAACPLGYTSGDRIPAGHPPVSGSSSGGNGGSSSSGTPKGTPASKDGVIWYTAGEIWTGDASSPRARAMAVDAARGTVLRVEPAGLPAGAPGEGETVVDLGADAFVMPGVVDSHTHFIVGGLSLGSADLRGASSREAFAAAVAAAAERLGPEEWILGGFWDDNHWGGGLPDASWIDAAAGGRPALLHRMDSHLALANSAAMALAGVGRDTPDPADGFIDRDPATGEPTGIFREGAMRLVTAAMPPPTAEHRRAAALAAARYALGKGITAVVDFGRSPFADAGASWSDLEEVYDPMADAGELPLRVYAFVPLEQWGAMATRVAARGNAHRGGRLFWGGVKSFADGSLGSRTALMVEPYRDRRESKGARMADPAALARDAAAADAAGLQVAVHAIGDAAVEEVLDLFETIAGAGASAAAAAALTPAPRGAPPRRAAAGAKPPAGGAWRALRVEHAQHILGPATAARFGALSAAAVAVANPQHLLTDAPMLLPALGADRATKARAFAWPLIASSGGGGGAALPAGSDWPVVPAEPLREGIPAAAARAAAFGAPVADAIASALRMHTSAAAGAAFAMGGSVGALAPGRRADFAVLSASPFGKLAAALEAAAAAAPGGGGGGGADGDAGVAWAAATAEAAPRVVSTFVDGRCVFGCA